MIGKVNKMAATSYAVSEGRALTTEYLRDLIVVLTQKEVRVRYRNTWLGYAWSLLYPMTFAVVYYIVFGVIMRVPIENYALFLLAGLFPWQWVSHSLSTAPNVFLVNATLIKKVKFPWSMLVASSVMNFGVQFMLSIPVVIGIALWYGIVPSFWTLLEILPIATIQFGTLYGLSLAIACLNLFFRDLDRLVSVGVAFLFFLTPIAYSTRMVPHKYETLLYLNPLASIMLCWQQIFLVGEVAWIPILHAAAISLVALAFGTLVYKRLSPRFAEVI